MARFSLSLKRWQKAAIVAFLFFVIASLVLYWQATLWKFVFAVLLIILVLVSFFWLEKEENLLRRLAKYSLPFVLSVLTAGYSLVFPPSFWSLSSIMLSAIAFYFFASRLKIPLPFSVREKVTYYWLDLVIYWVAFLAFLVNYYFFFYLLNLPPFWRYTSFSLILLAVGFYIGAFSLWARNRHTQELIFYPLLFVFALAQFLLVWSFYKMPPIGGGLLFVLLFYLFLESIDIFFRYQFIRQKDLWRLFSVLLVLGFLIFLVFRPFTVVGF